MLSWVKKYKPWLLIIIGTIVWSLTMVKSGLVYKYGLGFWGANGHDGIWHISLIESLSRGSLEIPIFAGEVIKNYHIGFDLLLAGIHVLTRIPAVNLYFQVIPPILAVLIGVLTYKLTKSLWSIFFVYFGGNWAWILGKGESTFWSHQSISTLINPPFALSLIILLTGLILLQKKHYYLTGILFGLLVEIKIYAAALAVFGLLIAGLKNKGYLKSFFVALLVATPLYLAAVPNSGKVIVFQPGWYLETMMGFSDRLNWPRFASAMTNYRLAGNWLKGIPAYLVALIIFFIGNLGTRLIFLRRKNDLFSQAIIFAGLAAPMLFLQTGTSWNSIQFFYYSLFFSGLLAGQFLSSQKLGFVSGALLIAATLPTTWITLKDIYLPSRPPAQIATLELEALKFLRTQPTGIVLVPPAIPDPYAPPPRPLYLYESTSYVSAFSNHPVYFEDQGSLTITGYPWQAREQQVKDFLTKNIDIKAVSYLYIPNQKFDASSMGFKNIFSNSETTIWSRQ